MMPQLPKVLVDRTARLMFRPPPGDDDTDYGPRCACGDAIKKAMIRSEATAADVPIGFVAAPPWFSFPSPHPLSCGLNDPSSWSFECQR